MLKSFQLRKYIILLFYYLVILSCTNRETPVEKSVKQNHPGNGTGKLIPINFYDRKYEDVDFNAHDIITADGWKIEYLVKDDTTRYDDIYIKWSKGRTEGVYCGGKMLEFRRHFIPRFKGENKTHLFFTHACATSCTALLTLSKSDKPVERTFVKVTGFDINLGQVLQIGDYDNMLERFNFALIDLSRGIEKGFYFKNKCFSTDDTGCIDSVQFNGNSVEVFATLTDRKDEQRSVQEVYTVKLEK
ncbi:hypothetical protein D3C87_245570 [compost metagenome]|uniref:hypothetical protein n=1 Tax=Pedobacter sp. ok626 TaxID=1761882 RepID=UPI000882120A|nr:hypothetical protein [Pedobacter sp. ok626]SDK39738.1 hypothetical protein SAMN04487898_10872 [Pedobacter sp. ok626]